MTSIIKVDQIQTAAGGVPTAADLGLNVSGSVLQFKNLQYTDTFTQNIHVGAINNLELSITPTSATSKIYIQAHVFFEAQRLDNEMIWYLMRDSTNLRAPAGGSRKLGIAMPTTGYVDNDQNSTPSVVNMSYYDSPATTSQVTYKIAVWADAATNFYINRTVTNTDSYGYERGICSITLMEIAG